MKLALTLRTRDNEDLVGAHLAFHLSAGVDFVIATDHLSADGTRDILREHERAGHLRLICKEQEHHVPGEWVDDMARLAVCEHDADWIIHSDVDEFWWPHGGDLKEALRAVPERFGLVFGVWRHFVPRPEDGLHFAERMTLRLSSHGPWAAPEDPFHPNVNVAHRADPDVRVRIGNHDLDRGPLQLRGWFPFEVLHFPLRTLAQARAKFEHWGRATGIDHGPHVHAAGAALRARRFDEHYGRYVVFDEDVDAGLSSGAFTVDVRIRDALRRLAGNPGAPLMEDYRFALIAPAEQPLEFPALAVAEQAALADDIAALPSPIARVEDRVNQLERRLEKCERPQPHHVLSRVPRRLARR